MADLDVENDPGVWGKLKRLLHGHRSTSSWALRQMVRVSAAMTVGMMITSFLGGISPAVMMVAIRGLIDAVTKVGPGGGLGLLFWVWLVTAFIAIVSEGVVASANQYFRTNLRDDADIELTTRIMLQASRQPVSFFEQSASQDTLVRLRDQVAHRFVELIHHMMAFFSGGLQSVTLLGILVYIEPWVLAVALPLFIPNLVYQWRLREDNIVVDANRVQQRRWVGYYLQTLTSPTSNAEVRLLGLGPHFLRRFRDIMTGFRREDVPLQRRDLIVGVGFALITLIAFFAVFGKVLLGVQAGTHSVGEVAIFLLVVMRLRRAIDVLTGSLIRGSEQITYVAALREFLEDDVLLEQPTRAEQAPEVRGEIELRDVGFAYPGTERQVLRDVSLLIRPGETVAIVGENGSGKTTLVKLLAGFYPADSGDVLLDGMDINQLDPRHVHSNLAFVFQDFGRYAGSVAENIGFGDLSQAHDRERIRAAARMAGVEEVIDNMPQGYETLLGREFGTLDPSGGIWQRIAIARAFLRDTPLLILDEPTAALDMRAEFELYQRLSDLAENRTTLLISHRFSTVSMADRILVMHQGRLVEQGTHEELLRLDGQYARLYGYYERRMNPDGVRHCPAPDCPLKQRAGSGGESE